MPCVLRVKNLQKVLFSHSPQEEASATSYVQCLKSQSLQNWYPQLVPTVYIDVIQPAEGHSALAFDECHLSLTSPNKRPGPNGVAQSAVNKEKESEKERKGKEGPQPTLDSASLPNPLSSVSVFFDGLVLGSFCCLCHSQMCAHVPPQHCEPRSPYPGTPLLVCLVFSCNRSNMRCADSQGRCCPLFEVVFCLREDLREKIFLRAVTGHSA